MHARTSPIQALASTLHAPKHIYETATTTRLPITAGPATHKVRSKWMLATQMLCAKLRGHVLLSNLITNLSLYCHFNRLESQQDNQTCLVNSDPN